MQSQQHCPKLFSFEFFPPKTDEGVSKLHKVRERLARVKPDFFSVTFGAGGFYPRQNIFHGGRYSAARFSGCTAFVMRGVQSGGYC